MGARFFPRPGCTVVFMLPLRIRRNRAVVFAAASAMLIGALYVGQALHKDLGSSRSERLLTVKPWHCDVVDPDGGAVVASSVETFHAGGRLEGRTRLEDRKAGRLLLEFSYRGEWQLDDPFLVEAIREYDYLHVDAGAFSRQRLSAIEAEFAEPEVSRIHALTERQLVYGANQSLYQCHRGVENAKV